MKLKSLEIELQTYGPNQGRYEAVIKYENSCGEVKMLLDANVSNAVLMVIGPVITEFAARASQQLCASIADSVNEVKQLPAIEIPRNLDESSAS